MGGNAWSIQVEAANTILEGVGREAESFTDVATKIETALEEISGLAGPKTASAATALVSERFLLELAALHGTVNASVSATTDAIMAYENGDTEMANNAQTSLGEIQDAVS